MKKAVIIVLVVLLAGMSGAAFYLYRSVDRLSHATENIAAPSAEETAAIIAKVGKLIRLPEGETPTLATVADPSKLKDQQFFAKAKTGYRVLIYPKAKEAILYDPFANKIVEVAPVTFGDAAQQQASVDFSPEVASSSTSATSSNQFFGR